MANQADKKELDSFFDFLIDGYKRSGRSEVDLIDAFTSAHKPVRRWTDRDVELLDKLQAIGGYDE